MAESAVSPESEDVSDDPPFELSERPQGSPRHLSAPGRTAAPSSRQATGRTSVFEAAQKDSRVT